MGYVFKVLQSNDEQNAGLLASMHHLRWQVFHKELRWTAGLINRNCLEFDEYDCGHANYIVRVNSDQQVDACCRLMPTDKPYMLAEHYPHFIQTQKVPNDPKIWEASRFASSLEARKQTQGTIMAQLIVAMIEFGLKKDISHFISLTTDRVAPIIRKAGWDPKPMGEKGQTPDDFSYSLIQTVSEEMLLRVKQRNNITDPVLQEFLQYADNITSSGRQNNNQGEALSLISI